MFTFGEFQIELGQLLPNLVGKFGEVYFLQRIHVAVTYCHC